MAMNAQKQQVLAWLDDNRSRLTDLSDEIWGYAEPAHREYKSARAHERFLETEGFEVESGVAGMPTAFVGTYGEGDPVIGFFAEYDATPGLSQQPVPYNEPIHPEGAGFSDCHNALGVGGTAAACAAKHAVDEFGLDGTVRIFGTPAEKIFTGKPYLARAGYFDDLDAQLAWHPRAYTTVLKEPGPGPARVFIIDFEGESSYSARPWVGTSALDATTLMQVNVNFMKEHLPRNAHPSVFELVSNGGQALTTIPARSQLWYGTRTSELDTADRIEEMLRRCAAAAASVTGADHQFRVVAATRPWLPNHAMMDLAFENMQLVGPPTFDEEDKAFTRELLTNIGLEKLGIDDIDEPFDESLSEPKSAVTSDFLGGADDVNEFCWHAPTCRIYTTYFPSNYGFTLPSWAGASLAKTGVAHTAFLKAAEVMATTALDLFTDESKLATVQAEYEERTADRDYPVLLPDDAEPPVHDTIPPFYPEGWEPPTDIA